MWLKTLSPLLALSVVLAGCGGGADSVSGGPVGPGADTSREAVRDLVDALNTADFNSAARFAVPGQAALASLAESATFGEVADALREGDSSVAANFWSGFAQGAGSFLIGEVSTVDGPAVAEQGVEFQAVVLTPETGDDREMMVRDVDGYRIDLFASFGAGLAGRMIAPVERLLATDSEDARLILDELKKVVPSLTVAVGQPGIPAETSQHLIQLIELIARVS